MKKRNAKVFAMFMTSVMTLSSLTGMPVMAAEPTEELEVVAEEATEEAEAEEAEAEEAEAEEAEAEEAEAEKAEAEEAEAEKAEAEKAEEDVQMEEAEEEAPVGFEEGAMEISNGWCGKGDTENNITIAWKYLSDKTLVLEAKGAAGDAAREMTDYTSYDQTPWYNDVVKEGYEIEHVEVLGRVKNIGSYAFEGEKNLKSIIISEYVEDVDAFAFANCSNLKTVEFTDNRNALVKEYHESAFENCENMVTITFTKDLEKIDRRAFYNCKSLAVNLEFDTNLKLIDDGAFWGCVSLKSLWIPYSVERVGGCATNGKTVDQAAASAKMEDKLGAFTNCTGLQSIDFQVTNGEGIHTIGDFAFYGCSGVGTVVVPGTVMAEEEFEGLGKYAFANCTGLSTATIEDDIRESQNIEIELYGTFARCTNLSEVTLGTKYYWAYGDHEDSKGTFTYGSDIVRIGKRAFYDCNSLKTVNLSRNGFDEKCTEIGSEAFWKCTSLEHIDIPYDVELIDESAFRNCYKLDNVVVPDATKRIGDNAFYNCVGMSNIMLPVNLAVNGIGTDAFNAESGKKMTLVDIYFRGGKNEWEAVQAHTDLTNVLVVSPSEKIKANVYYYSDENLTVPQNITATYMKSDKDESADYVLLSWDAVTLPDGTQPTRYEVYQNHMGTSTVEKQMDSIVPVWTEVYGPSRERYEALITTLTRGDLYNWRVRAKFGDTYFSTLSDMKTYPIPSGRDIINVEELKLNKLMYYVKVDDSAEATLTIKPEDAASTTFSWKSLDDTVASVSVSSDGKTANIIGLKEGTTKITVTSSNGISTEATVVVSNKEYVPVESITTDSKATVEVGKTTTVQLSVKPENYSPTTFTWESGNNQVATVKPLDDELSAVITGVKKGTAVITVTSDNGKTYECTVEVTEAAKPDDKKGAQMVMNDQGGFDIYVDGVLDETYTGLANFNGGDFMVIEGKFRADLNGAFLDPVDGKCFWFLANGQVQYDFKGTTMYDGQFFAVENGKVNLDQNGFYDFDGKTFWYSVGRVNMDVNGLQMTFDGKEFYYCANGMIQDQYSGIVTFDGFLWYVKEGRLASEFSGQYTWDVDGKTYTILNGQVQ